MAHSFFIHTQFKLHHKNFKNTSLVLFIHSTHLKYVRFPLPVGVSRVVCGGHLRVLALRATRLLLQWLLHWWRVNGSTTRMSLFLEPTALLRARGWTTASTVFQVIDVTRRESNPTYQLQSEPNPLHHFPGLIYLWKCKTRCQSQ